MKKLLSIFLILVFCISLVSCKDSDSASNKGSGKESTEEISESNESSSFFDDDATDESSASESIIDNEQNYPESPALYKVTNDKGNIAWLFGSIHVGDKSFYPLPEYVTNAFNASDALAVEFDIVSFEKDFSAQTQALTALVYKDGSTIKDHLPKETYETAKAILEENGHYMSQYDYYMPCLWQSIITSLFYEKHGIDTENGVDRHLIDEANKLNKKIHDIESAEFQYGMMAGFSEKLQIYLLQDAIDLYNNNLSVLGINLLKSLWLKGDTNALKFALSGANIESDDNTDIMDEYNNAMIADRNIGMAEYAENALKSGEEVFICIGAAHIIGEGGLVEILTQRGYKIERVSE